MSMLIVGLITIYTLIGVSLFNCWYNAFRRDRSMNDEDLRISKLVLVIATLVWPLVVPFSYLELMQTQSKKQKGL